MFSDKKTSNEGDFFRNNFLPAGRNMPKHDSDRRFSGSIHLVFHCNAKNFIFQVLFSNRFLKKVRKEESGLKVDASGKPQQYKKPSAFRRNDYPFCFADGCFCYEVIEMTVCMWFAEACFRPYLEAGFLFQSIFWSSFLFSLWSGLCMYSHPVREYITMFCTDHVVTIFCNVQFAVC